jgi:hypothetical protein
MVDTVTYAPSGRMAPSTSMSCDATRPNDATLGSNRMAIFYLLAVPMVAIAAAAAILLAAAIPANRAGLRAWTAGPLHKRDDPNSRNLLDWLPFPR